MKISKANKGHIVLEETRRKISEANKGKIVSEETRRKLSEANKNPSEETRRKLSEANKGEKNGMYGMKGKKSPRYGKDWRVGKTKEEIKDHNRKSSEGHKKPILQFTKDMIFIKEWKSAKDAGNELGIDCSSITNCCQGKRKSAGKFVWRYKEKTEN